ncbi:hypothetical protein SAMN04488137_2626 [Fictibacillus solisalsi]|uniref:Uncharacterized protein n=1 Tax=Fictibacillus solisalsi TaxID=459525 RepID=A0A1G9X8N0_9BACL|nr:hypothetical protein [Fictibacillus solisalsi]SDM92816.1 hypothetical protein SAMN04488137_2626 [Fictibacillus solisalsi]
MKNSFSIAIIASMIILAAGFFLTNSIVWVYALAAVWAIDILIKGIKAVKQKNTLDIMGSVFLIGVYVFVMKDVLTS